MFSVIMSISYTLVRPPVHGDNPRAFSSELTPAYVNGNGITV